MFNDVIEALQERLIVKERSLEIGMQKPTLPQEIEQFRKAIKILKEYEAVLNFQND